MKINAWILIVVNASLINNLVLGQLQNEYYGYYINLIFMAVPGNVFFLLGLLMNLSSGFLIISKNEFSKKMLYAGGLFVLIHCIISKNYPLFVFSAIFYPYMIWVVNRKASREYFREKGANRLDSS